MEWWSYSLGLAQKSFGPYGLLKLFQINAKSSSVIISSVSSRIFELAHQGRSYRSGSGKLAITFGSHFLDETNDGGLLMLISMAELILRSNKLIASSAFHKMLLRNINCRVMNWIANGFRLYPCYIPLSFKEDWTVRLLLSSILQTKLFWISMNPSKMSAFSRLVFESFVLSINSNKATLYDADDLVFLQRNGHDTEKSSLMKGLILEAPTVDFKSDSDVRKNVNCLLMNTELREQDIFVILDSASTLDIDLILFQKKLSAADAIVLKRRDNISFIDALGRYHVYMLEKVLGIKAASGLASAELTTSCARLESLCFIYIDEKKFLQFCNPSSSVHTLLLASPLRCFSQELMMMVKRSHSILKTILRRLATVDNLHPPRAVCGAGCWNTSLCISLKSKMLAEIKSLAEEFESPLSDIMTYFTSTIIPTLLSPVFQIHKRVSNDLLFWDTKFHHLWVENPQFEQRLTGDSQRPRFGQCACNLLTYTDELTFHSLSSLQSWTDNVRSFDGEQDYGQGDTNSSTALDTEDYFRRVKARMDQNEFVVLDFEDVALGALQTAFNAANEVICIANVISSSPSSSNNLEVG